MLSFARWLHWHLRKSRDNLWFLNFAWHLKRFILSIVSCVWFDHRKSCHYWKYDLWDYMSLEIRSILLVLFFFPLRASYYIILEGGGGSSKFVMIRGSNQLVLKSVLERQKPCNPFSSPIVPYWPWTLSPQFKSYRHCGWVSWYQCPSWLPQCVWCSQFWSTCTWLIFYRRTTS